jgi:uncharacterized protein
MEGIILQGRCLILFVKYPQAGEVKTRLGRWYGAEFAAGLYREFIFDILDTLAGGAYRLQIHFAPPEKETPIKNLLGQQYEYRQQCGSNLGERMKNAFAACFAEGFQSAVLIGSDFPDLPRKIIDEAFALLEGENDTVIGPAVDGGYYLIGLESGTFLPEIFYGISWGTNLVLQETLNILHSRGGSIQLVQPWRDVDTPDDLANLAAASKGTAFIHSRTIRYLQASNIFPDM